MKNCEVENDTSTIVGSKEEAEMIKKKHPQSAKYAKNGAHSRGT
jgi:hypothetical protein